MDQVRAVLGIDAAWTGHKASGVALLVERDGKWRCVGVAPSYAQFAVLPSTPVDWDARAPTGSRVQVPDLLSAAEALAGGARPQVVAVDMPFARVPIAGRRAADDAISKAFGARRCGAHSPNATRPGVIGVELHRGFEGAGFELVTKGSHPAGHPGLLEVYPHPALLHLMSAAIRVPYKVSKVRTYRRPTKATVHEGWHSLRMTWGHILKALRNEVDGIPCDLERVLQDAGARSARLKPYEDAMDAIISAWVGVQYLNNNITPYGDFTSTVWCPPAPSVGGEA